MQHLRSAQGFTLPEVILIVAVMAIVSAMAFPDIVQFFKRQSVEQEKIIQREIIKALDAYSKEQTANFNNDPDMVTVPYPQAAVAATPEMCSQPGGWGALISRYSNLATEEICNDVWGLPRTYLVAQGDLDYRDGSFRTYYVTIHSNGENKNLDTTSAWTDADSYGTFQAQGDDHVEKFSDVKLKTELFEETLRRMERIVEALDRYAQAKYNEALLTEEINTSFKIYYPPERRDFVDTTFRPDEVDEPVSGGGWYGTNVRDDMIRFGQEALDSAEVDETTRLESMRILMRALGLPEEFATNALTGSPFFYYSNPIVAPGNNCGGADRRKTPPYMPPKITIDALPCN